MSQPQADALTAQIVEEYLLEHPDFFQHRPALVERLALPHQEMGAVSLVHVQLARQRQRIEELEEEITAFMSLAATNDKTFHEFMELESTLLHCSTMEQAVAALEDKAQVLGLTAYLRLSAAPCRQYQYDKDAWQRFSTNYLNGQDAYLGRLRQSERHQLFGDNAHLPELGSYVVLPLGKGRALGFLAFSSEDGGHFQPNMDTLFLRHLALVLAHLIDTLPWQTIDESRRSHSST